MFRDLSILLRLPTVNKPQTENRRSTKACDAGAVLCYQWGSCSDRQLVLPELGSSTLTLIHLHIESVCQFCIDWCCSWRCMAAALLCEVVPWLCAPWSASFAARSGNCVMGTIYIPESTWLYIATSYSLYHSIGWNFPLKITDAFLIFFMNTDTDSIPDWTYWEILCQQDRCRVKCDVCKNCAVPRSLRLMDILRES